jgi:hypothetical protein
VTGLVEPGPLWIDWQRLASPDLDRRISELAGLVSASTR